MAEREPGGPGRRRGPSARPRAGEPGGADGPGTLYVCATPIGNLGDVTLRVLQALKDVALIAAEDTRHTRKLLTHFDIHTPATSLFAHNEAAKTDVLLRELRAGRDVALVTDAGLPGVSDPGARAVAAAIAAGLPVTVLPGASAPVTAVVASGLAAPEASWCFVGFLPRRPAELRAAWVRWRAMDALIVAFETPVRLPRTLRELVTLDPAVRGAVCRELTKLHEEVARGTVAELAGRFGAGTPPGAGVPPSAGVPSGPGTPPGAGAAPSGEANTAAEVTAATAASGGRLRGEITLVLDLTAAGADGDRSARTVPARAASPQSPPPSPETAARRLLQKGLSRRDTVLAIAVCLGVPRRVADELVREIAREG